jgi:hypothetical protein
VKSSKFQSKDDSGFFEPYAEYSRTLRTWLVAYGIGGPAVIITNPDALKVVSANGQAALIGWLFLSGVAAQVLISFCNKIAMWYVYFGEIDKAFQKTRRHRLADWFSEQFWPDLICDAISLFAFAYSTVLLFKAFAVFVDPNV